MRGLKEQQRLAGVLADENQAMTDEFNRQVRQHQAPGSAASWCLPAARETACRTPPPAALQAAQIQQGRTEVRRCQEQIAAQHLALQGLAAERDACRHSAQEASQQVKVSTPVCSRCSRPWAGARLCCRWLLTMAAGVRLAPACALLHEHRCCVMQEGALLGSLAFARCTVSLLSHQP